MSKRYGRNQRRAHRNRIAGLEAQVAELQKDYDGMYRLARDLSNEINDAKRIVGEYCVAFEPRIQSMNLKYQDYVTVQQFDYNHGTNMAKWWDHRAPSFDATVRIDHIRLPVMCALAAEDIRLSRHFKVSYDGKVYGYAIDLMAFKFARFPQVLLRQVGERIAALILAENSKDFETDSPKQHTRDEPAPRNYTPQFRFPGSFPRT